MVKLVAISPIGKNGQTVVPVQIRKMFKVAEGHNLVGFYIEGNRVEIAPVEVQKSEVNYSAAELNQAKKLAREKGGKTFMNARSAKAHLKSL